MDINLCGYVTLPQQSGLNTLLFIGCAALAVYQAQPAQRNDSRFDMLAWPVILICFFNTLTRFIPVGLSIIIFASLLFSLAWAFLTVYHMGPQDKTFYWTTRTPLTIFFAWATVATVVNVGQVLSRLNWTGFGIAATTWIALLLIVATLIGIFVSVRYREAAYGMVFIWAFWGIVAAQDGAIAVITSAIVCTIALLLMIGWLFLSGRSGKQPIGPSTA